MKQGSNLLNTRYYFSDFEKDVTGSSTKFIHYITSPAELVAIVVREGGSETYNYVYTDHLGSILTVTDNNGNVVAEQNFDAWGRRRNPSTWDLLPPTEPTPLAWLTRGYTGHEHLDKFGLINMNGRMYDPVIGRMLSADNLVPDATSTQGYNRYSYAFNNPLSYTDPDGQFPLLLIMAQGALVNGIGYLLSTSGGGDGNKFDGGKFAQSLVVGAFSSVLSFGVGEAAKSMVGVNKVIFQTASHAVIQGAVSSMQGGGFQSGMASSLFGSISAAFVGGMSAKANGGNFWQCASQAGIVAAFNHGLHNASVVIRAFAQVLQGWREHFLKLNFFLGYVS